MNWGDHFDHIYCIHYLGSGERLDDIRDELRRVGIADSGVFSFVYTSDEPWERLVAGGCPKISNDEKSQRCYVNLGLATARMYREAIALGYRRILVLEDDVRFLNDVGRVWDMVERMPEREVVQLDKLIPKWEMTREEYSRMVRERAIEGHEGYFEGGKDFFTSGACYAVTDKGMGNLLELMERLGPRPVDILFQELRSRAVIDRNVAIQIAYGDAVNFSNLNAGNTHHKGYMPQGLEYADYNVPDGYGYGTDFIGKGKGKKMKIVVYAITKNERKFVERWMESMDEADSIVVLDTGSTDGTCEALRNLGAVVIETEYEKWSTLEEYDRIVAEGGRPWRFDWARNDSIDAAKKCVPDADLLVCTDLDEILVKGWREKLEKAWTDAVESGRNPTTAQYEYVWSFNADGTDGTKFLYEKVHRPDCGRWGHPVHEILVYDDVRKDMVYVSGMRLEHHPDPAKSRGQYLPLLEMSVREDPDDDRNMHYLGREYMFRRMWEKSIETLKRHLAMPSARWNAERAASMRFIARDLRELARPVEAAEWLRKAIAEAPDQREAGVELAQMAYDMTISGDSRFWWPIVVEGAEAAVAVTRRNLSYLSKPEAWSEKPWDLLSLGLWYTGRKGLARLAVAEALRMAPNDKRIASNAEFMRNN